MTTHIGRGHTYQRPPGLPADYGGPGDRRGHDAPQHETLYTVPVDSITKLYERIDNARDLLISAHREVTDPRARSALYAALQALADPAEHRRAS